MAKQRIWVIRRVEYGEYVYVSQGQAPGMQYVTTNILNEAASFRTKQDALWCVGWVRLQGDGWALANLELWRNDGVIKLLRTVEIKINAK